MAGKEIVGGHHQVLGGSEEARGGPGSCDTLVKCHTATCCKLLASST